MKELICIVCPNGCHLKVDEHNDYSVTGNKCERGVDYGKAELCNPVRVVTSTVKLQSSRSNRLPVKTNGAIPKALIFEVMKVIDTLEVTAPVKVGQILVEDLLETGISLVSCKNVE